MKARFRAMDIAKLYAAAELGAPPDVPLQAPLAAARPPPRSLSGKAKAAARHAAGSAMQAVKSLSGKNLLANMMATKSGRMTCNWGNPEYGAAELEPLLAFTTLVDIRWLARFAAQEDDDLKPIPSWQALPPEAVVQKAQLEAYTGIGLPILVLSYPWLDRRHPDPHRQHLKTLRPLLNAIVAYCDEEGGEGCSFGVLWDFMALPQACGGGGHDAEPASPNQTTGDARTPAQIERFRKGLGSINVWYSSPHTFILCLDLPPPVDAVNATPYQRRGWCVFEQCLSSLVKNSNCFLRLSGLGAADDGTAATSSWFEIITACAAQRSAPMAPDAFEKMMREGVAAAEGGIVFTSGKDLTEVTIPQYRAAFLRVLGHTNALDFSGLGWNDDDVTQLAAALAFAGSEGCLTSLQSIDLYNNELTDDSLYLLASTLSHSTFDAKQLKSVDTRRCNTRTRAAREALEQALGKQPARAAAGGGGGGASSSSNGAAAAQPKVKKAALGKKKAAPGKYGSSSSSPPEGHFSSGSYVFVAGAPAAGAISGARTLTIGNRHHDETATRGPVGGSGRHHWVCYVRPSADLRVEWVEFTLHPTFRTNVIKVAEPTRSSGQYEVRGTGWGTFEVGLRVKLAGAPSAIKFEHLLNFEPDKPDTHTVYHAKPKG